MVRMRSQHLVFTTACLALLAACGGGASAPAGDAPPEIAERQKTYKAIGGAYKEIRKQLEGGSPDLAVIETQATAINERAGKLGQLFPAGTSVDDGYDTEALPAIWEKPDEFKKALTDFVDASAALRTAAGGGDAAAVGEAVKTLGGTCKSCHDKFRVEDD